MTFEESLDYLRDLDWDPEAYAIFGSGPLAVRGIRPAHDIDVLVVPELWSAIEAEHPASDHAPGVRVVILGPLEVLSGWWPFVGTPEAIIESADMIDGLPVVSLDLVVRWKRLSGRPKDIVDCELIEHYSRALS